MILLYRFNKMNDLEFEMYITVDVRVKDSSTHTHNSLKILT